MITHHDHSSRTLCGGARRRVADDLVYSRTSCTGSPANALAARIDPYVDKQRVVVMTDIANEPDDQMSMVRFLVYANQFDIEGLVATTSTWMKNKVRPDVIQTLVDAYARCGRACCGTSRGFPPPTRCASSIVAGQPGTAWRPLARTRRLRAPS